MTELDKDILLYHQKWNRSTWSLEDRKEIVFKQNMQLQDIAEVLSSIHNITPSSDLRILYLPNTSVVELLDLNNQMPYHSYRWNNISSNPSFLSSMGYSISDGDLLVVQDVKEPLRSFTKEETAAIEKYQAQRDNTDVYFCQPSIGSAVSNAPFNQQQQGKRAGETGIKIKSLKDREREKSNNSEEDLAKLSSSTSCPEITAGNDSNSSKQEAVMPPLINSDKYINFVDSGCSSIYANIDVE